MKSGELFLGNRALTLVELIAIIAILAALLRALAGSKPQISQAVCQNISAFAHRIVGHTGRIAFCWFPVLGAVVQTRSRMDILSPVVGFVPVTHC